MPVTPLAKDRTHPTTLAKGAIALTTQNALSSSHAQELASTAAPWDATGDRATADTPTPGKEPRK
jgi:hypothetical protein